jgi:hypothetical protein
MEVSTTKKTLLNFGDNRLTYLYLNADKFQDLMNANECN